MLLQTALLLLVLWSADLHSEQNYLAATIDKHHRLRQAPPPRLLLVGGSNLAFGIDSPLLYHLLGREVVNMGLVGGLGLDFMLREVAPSVQAGDIVVLSPEYDLLGGGFNPVNLRQILEYRPASLCYLQPLHWKRVLIDGGFAILSGVVRRAIWDRTKSPGAAATEDAIYCRRGFNAYGDLTNHYGMASRLLESASTATHPPSIPKPPVLDHLKKFARLCARREALVVFTCPPQPVEIFPAEATVLQAIMQELKTVPGLILLDSPQDQCYPQSQFYDTGYHLLPPATITRTRKLAQSLQPLVKSVSGASSVRIAGNGFNLHLGPSRQTSHLHR